MSKRKKRKDNKKGLITFALVLIIGIIVVIVVYQGMTQGGSQNTQQYAASEFFEIFDATIDDGQLVRNETTGDVIAVKIYTISFKVRPVSGDAHNVIIQGWAKAEPFEIGTILQGQYGEVKSQRTSQTVPYLSEKNADGKFPMEIRIMSKETLEDPYITIYFSG